MARLFSFLQRFKGVLLVFFLWMLLYAITTHEKRWIYRPIIEFDVAGYYSYLPSHFVYHDLKLDYYHDSLYFKNHSQYIPAVTNDGKRIIKYTMGLAYLYSPFYVMATMYAKMNHYPTDGFSLPYQIALHFAALAYLLIGLLCLRKFLRYYVNERAAILTLLLIAFGTNLYYYVTGESGYPHAYNFTLYSILLYATKRSIQQVTWKNLSIIALCLALLTLIRPVNVMAAFIPVFWEVNSFTTLKQRLYTFLNAWWKIALLIVIPFVVLFPQLLYWKISTGNWILYSYNNEAFDFTKPELINGLFSYRKGWFVYTPLWLLLVPGLILLYKQSKRLSLFTFKFFLVYCYVIFSWWSWFYGGSFGCRALIDVYPVFALALACCIQYLLKTNIVVKVLSAIVLIFIVKLNIFQSDQYKANTMHWANMDKETYWEIFGKVGLTPEERAKCEAIWCCNYENAPKK